MVTHCYSIPDMDWCMRWGLWRIILSLIKILISFFIVEKNGSRFLKDPLVKETVWAIIEVFFRENSNVLLYVCDTSDGRQASRDRLFDIWFYEYEKQEEYIHLTAKVESDSIYYFASVILKITHPHLDEIKEAFDVFTEDMKDKLS